MVVKFLEVNRNIAEIMRNIIWKSVWNYLDNMLNTTYYNYKERSIKQIMNGGMAMSSYKDYKKRALQNPEVKAEYDALQPEYDIIQAMIDARVQQNMTQKDLSAKTGITQADISRIENGTRNPSLSMVKKLAQGLGMQLKLEFVPMPTKNKM